MKAVYITEAYKVEIKDIDSPALGKQDVLVNVKVAGICGSDMHTYKDLHPFRKPPVIIGHEVSGVVADFGEDVLGLNVGDKVAIEPQIGCGTCEHCLAGLVNYCEHRGAPGIGDWYGGMAEYFVAPANTVYKLPEGMTFEEGALVEPLAVAVHAVRKANIKVGDKVAILGAGPIGLLTLAAAKSAGATSTLVTDILEYPLESAKRLGATQVQNTKDNKEWIRDSLEILGSKFDKVLVAVGIPGIIDDALSLLKKGGRVVTIAMFQQDQTFDIHNLQQYEKEIVGCMTYNREDTLTAIDLLAVGAIDTKEIISHQLPYSEAAKGFQMVDKKEDSVIKVLVHFEK